MHNSAGDITLLAVLQSIVKHKKMFFAVLIVGIALGGLSCLIVRPTFEASSAVRVGKILGEPARDFNLLKAEMLGDVKGFDEIATRLTAEVSALALPKLPKERLPAFLRGCVSLERVGRVTEELNVVRVRARCSNPELAKALARLFAQRVFNHLKAIVDEQEALRSEEIEAEIASISSTARKARQRLAELRRERQTVSEKIRQLHLGVSGRTTARRRAAVKEELSKLSQRKDQIDKEISALQTRISLVEVQTKPLSSLAEKFRKHNYLGVLDGLEQPAILSEPVSARKVWPRTYINLTVSAVVALLIAILCCLTLERVSGAFRLEDS